MHLFTKCVKYPRTFHLPWSPGCSNDDRVLSSTDHFEGQDVIVTVKCDGENFSLYSDYCHARAISNRSHPSRSWIKSFHSKISGLIPDGWRICGENLYAYHSIFYTNLSSYFLAFSIWNDKNYCLNWSETEEYAKLLDIELVPVLYKGKWDLDKIKSLYQPIYDNCECEGYVVRLSSGFHYSDFGKSVAKYVRSNHVGSHGFWSSKMVKNLLK